MKKSRNAPREIYNMETDANETKDVALQHPELIKRFEEILQKEHQQACIQEWEFVNPKFTIKK